MKIGKELLVQFYKPKSFIFLVIVFLPNPSIFAASILLPLLAANASFKRSLSSSFENRLSHFHQKVLSLYGQLSFLPMMI